MYYIIYETINIINNKKYIGKHRTKKLDDNYLGSGLLLRKAIKKYGKNNFIRCILFVFDNEIDMNIKEQELITQDIINSKEYYNIALGGNGGNIVLFKEHPLYQITCNNIKIAQRKRLSELSKNAKKLHLEKRIGMYGKSQTDYQKQTVRNLFLGKKKTKESVFKQKVSLLKTIHDPNYIRHNIKHTEKSKLKISENHADVSGSNNPMFGKQHKNISKIKQSNKAKNRQKITCKYCNKINDISNHTRWHGENCKRRFSA